jgi:acyl-CoA synthetase (AMP-forming)/AMP-acid ligase II
MDDATYQRLLARAERTSDLLTVDQFLQYWAKEAPDRVAFDGDDLTLTFAGLEEASARIAGALLAQGLTKGDRIAWLGKNSATYFALLLGAARAGIVMTPIGWRLAEPEVAYILEDAEARVLFLGDGFEAAAATLGKRPGLIACYSGEDARKLLRAAHSRRPARTKRCFRPTLQAPPASPRAWCFRTAILPVCARRDWPNLFPTH